MRGDFKTLLLLRGTIATPRLRIAAPGLRLGAAIVSIAGALGLAKLADALIPGIPCATQRTLFAMSAQLLAAAMTLAAAYAAAKLAVRYWLSLPATARFHGPISALALALCGLIGWTVVLRAAARTRNEATPHRYGELTMAQRSNDHPDIIVFPPVILLATVALGFLLQWLTPLPLPGEVDPALRIGAGVVAAALGVLCFLLARVSLVRRGTNLNPLRPTTALVTEGVYRWSRNPIYVGGIVAMVGVGLVFKLGWLLPLLVPSVLALHFGVVRREERYLEAKFGDEYRRYKASVPRYLGTV